MSFFGTIQNAGNALNAAQIGLQVTGNNIANANTPGYIRKSLLLTNSSAGGTGVQVVGIRLAYFASGDTFLSTGPTYKGRPLTV